MLSVGHQLMQARKARGLTIEDVAFETRIPHSLLRDMENDDLSNFANLTYAKGFLKLYSRFLHLDLSEYLDEFDTSAISEATGHEWAQTASVVRTLNAPAIAADPPRQFANFFGLAVLLLMITVAGFIIFRSPKDEIPGSPAPSSTTRQGQDGANPPASASEASNSGAATAAAADSSVPAAGAGTVPPPGSQVRRATVVDDQGNEIPPPRVGRP